MRPQTAERGDVRAVARTGADIEVQLQAGAVAGGAGAADLPAGGDLPAGAYGQLREVAYWLYLPSLGRSTT